jgi:hypothetical protein
VNFYLIPQTIYVGDRAVLAIPLDADTDLPEFTIWEDDIWALAGASASPGFPKGLTGLTDLQIHRITLDRHGGNHRLLIEFTAWSPGQLELPAFEIGGVSFSGLYIEVSSILAGDKNAFLLSPPASPLAVPGSSLLIYGTMAGGILVLLVVLWAGIWGRKNFGKWIRKWKRRRLIRSLSGMEKRMRRHFLKGQKEDNEAMVNYLSAEFRKFLSIFTGQDCKAMTAGELGKLPPLGNDDAILTGSFLGAFFRCCDDLRFSGAKIAAGEILPLLEDLKLFAEKLDRAEKGKNEYQF